MKKVTMDEIYEVVKRFKDEDDLELLFGGPHGCSGYIDVEDLKKFVDHLNSVLQRREQ